MKTYNEYSGLFPDFDKTPKAVIAAIALSLARRLNEDNWDKAKLEIMLEWSTLYKCGIVPQKPIRSYSFEKNRQHS